MENSSGKVTLFTLFWIFFPLQSDPVCYCVVIFSFLSPTIVFRTSSILPFLSLRWKSPLVKHTVSMNSLMNSLKGFFPPADASVSQPFQETHTHTHTHSGVSSPQPTVAYALPADLPWPWCHYFPHSAAVCLRVCGCLSENSCLGAFTERLSLPRSRCLCMCVWSA